MLSALLALTLAFAEDSPPTPETARPAAQEPAQSPPVTGEVESITDTVRASQAAMKSVDLDELLLLVEAHSPTSSDTVAEPETSDYDVEESPIPGRVP